MNILKYLQAGIPGCKAYSRISSTVSTSLSAGACNTIITEPSRHNAQPNFPSTPNCSFRNTDASTALSYLGIWIESRLGYPISTLSAPNGVTRMAGAKVYAAKLAISPTITVEWVCFDIRNKVDVLVIMPAHQIGLRRYPWSSPLKPCRSVASIRPFFVMIKLVPNRVQPRIQVADAFEYRSPNLS